MDDTDRPLIIIFSWVSVATHQTRCICAYMTPGAQNVPALASQKSNRERSAEGAVAASDT